jgi:hypothetical protein
MDFVIDVLSLGKADASIIWVRDQGRDYVVFLDGGQVGHASLVLAHYNSFIRPALRSMPYLIAVNTHMHSDHLGGLLEIIRQLHAQGDQLRAVYFNNPLSNQVLQEQVKSKVTYKMRFSKLKERIEFLNESLEQAKDLVAQLLFLGIECRTAFAGTTLLPPPYEQRLRIIGPTPEFYGAMMSNAGRTLQWGVVDVSEMLTESLAGDDPCQAIARYQDTDWDNKASVVLELTTERGEKYLFTADASEPSFLSIEQSGYPLTDYTLVQLPHHGSRRNLSAARVRQFGAKMFWVAAPNNEQHPSPDLIKCIELAISDSQIHFTHEIDRGGCVRFTNNRLVFPPCSTAIVVPIGQVS